MDSLKNLPVDDKSILSSEQKSVLNKYIGGSAPNGDENSSNSSNKSTPKWKTVLYMAAVFLALVNPITQGLLSKLPTIGDNYAYMLMITTLLYTLCTCVVLYFM